MYRFVLACCAAAVLLSACGVKRPLMRPADIPAYEAEQEKKRQERENFRREQAAE